MQTRTQKFALQAYPCIEAQAKLKDHAKYRTLALTFPNMILQSGLSQATGFLLAKGKDEHMTYLNDLACVMADGLADGAALHQRTINSQVGEYQELTRRALDASAWLKRYTQALLKAE